MLVSKCLPYFHIASILALLFWNAEYYPADMNIVYQYIHICANWNETKLI